MDKYIVITYYILAEHIVCAQTTTTKKIIHTHPNALNKPEGIRGDGYSPFALCVLLYTYIIRSIAIVYTFGAAGALGVSLFARQIVRVYTYVGGIYQLFVRIIYIYVASECAHSNCI